jgi:hypothetical protein
MRLDSSVHWREVVLSSRSETLLIRRPKAAKQSTRTIQESDYSCSYLTYPTIQVSMALPSTLKCMSINVFIYWMFNVLGEVGVMFSVDPEFKQRYSLFNLSFFVLFNGKVYFLTCSCITDETQNLQECELHPDTTTKRNFNMIVDFSKVNGSSAPLYCSKKNKFFVVLMNEFGMVCFYLFFRCISQK